MKKILIYILLILNYLCVYSQDIGCGTIPKTEEEMALQAWYGNYAYLYQLLHDSTNYYNLT